VYVTAQLTITPLLHDGGIQHPAAAGHVWLRLGHILPMMMILLILKHSIKKSRWLSIMNPLHPPREYSQKWQNVAKTKGLTAVFRAAPLHPSVCLRANAGKGAPHRPPAACSLAASDCIPSLKHVNNHRTLEITAQN
jgi:hypothetical protein